MIRYVYIQVSNDEFELPLAIADSAGELALETNTPIGCIFSSVSRAKKPKKRKDGTTRFYPFRKVKIEE